MELLEQVESYLERTRIPASTFGRMAVGDPRFVRDLRSGRQPRRKTQERVRAYLVAVSNGSTSRSLASCELHVPDDPETHPPRFQQIGLDAGDQM